MIVLVLTVMQARYHLLCYYPLWLCVMQARPMLTILLLTMPLLTMLLLTMPLLTLALCDAATHYATTYHGTV